MVKDAGSGPTQDETQAVLRDLAEGRMSRAQASDWATPWVIEEAGDVDEEVVWELLDWLGGADTQTAPGVYLYGPEDFRQWLEDFDAPRPLTRFHRQCSPGPTPETFVDGPIVQPESSPRSSPAIAARFRDQLVGSSRDGFRQFFA